MFLATACGSETTGAPESLIGWFDLFWETFDAQYSYVTYKRVNWDSLRIVYRPRPGASTTQTELIAVLRQMVASLRDVHVNLTTPSDTTQHIPASTH